MDDEVGVVEVPFKYLSFPEKLCYLNSLGDEEGKEEILKRQLISPRE